MPDLSLDSPLVTLGALYFAGNRGVRGSGPLSGISGGESGKGLIAGGFGGASAEWAGDQVTGLAGDSLPVSDVLGQAIAGAALSKFGGMIPQNKAMARGIHYNAATQAMQEIGLSAGDLIGDVTGGGGSTSSTSSTTSTPVRSSPTPSARTHGGMRNGGGSNVKRY